MASSYAKGLRVAYCFDAKDTVAYCFDHLAKKTMIYFYVISTLKFTL